MRTRLALVALAAAAVAGSVLSAPSQAHDGSTHTETLLDARGDVDWSDEGEWPSPAKPGAKPSVADIGKVVVTATDDTLTAAVITGPRGRKALNRSAELVVNTTLFVELTSDPTGETESDNGADGSYDLVSVDGSRAALFYMGEPIECADATTRRKGTKERTTTLVTVPLTCLEDIHSLFFGAVLNLNDRDGDQIGFETTVTSKRLVLANDA